MKFCESSTEYGIPINCSLLFLLRLDIFVGFSGSEVLRMLIGAVSVQRASKRATCSD